ncbi:hypothetical protein D5086_023885 [Populus alba]|uniref:Uncharacterized protein n=1 Tax=Populus alba TaxID=43335 RepID=A0ACC4BCL8_POPAL
MDYSNLIFSQMGHDSSAEIVIWNAMIRGYAFNGPFQECIQMFDEMPQRGLKPHNFTYPYVINSCCELEWYGRGKRVHCEIVKSGFESSYAVANSLFNMYLKMPASFDVGLASNCKLDDARYAKAGKVANAREGVTPDGYTFVSVLSACSNLGDLEFGKYIHYLVGDLSQSEVMVGTALTEIHGGLVEEGHIIFKSMEKDYKIIPKTTHYGCLIDMLCRNGQLEEAMLLVEAMPFKPDVAIWGALLGGCRVTGDLKLAEKVVEKATELETNESGVYVLLSNIHASAGQWIEAADARKKMDEKKISKKAGSSVV